MLFSDVLCYLVAHLVAPSAHLLIELIIVVTPNVIEFIIAAIPMSLLSSAFQNSDWLTAVIPPSKIFEFETYHVMDNGCNVDAQTYKNKHQFNLIYKDHKYLSSG